MVSQATDLIPQGWIPDPTTALVWWLANPLLLHFCPKAMADAAERLPEMDGKEKQRVLWALRGRRIKLRAAQTIPDDLPVIPREELEELYQQVDTAAERGDCRRFGNTLHPCEFGWFADQLRKGLAARAAETIETRPPMDELAYLLESRQIIAKKLVAARKNAKDCPCINCQWGADVAWAALELWDERLLALVPKSHKKAVKALNF